MVTTRAKAAGTQQKPDPASAQLPKAAKATRKKAAKTAKTATTAKAGKTTKVAKTKGAKKAAKTAKVAKAAKAAKAAKSKTSKKAVKKSAGTLNVEELTQSSDEEDEEEYTPQPKRRKIVTPESSTVQSVAMGRFPSLQIGRWDYMKEMSIPAVLKDKFQHPLPKIWIGGSAPQPRWVVAHNECVPVPRHPGLSEFKLRGGFIIDRFGGPQWALDEGDYKRWGGLEYQVLYELAYVCLEYMLNDTEHRKEIYASLAYGPLYHIMTTGEEWHPALPPAPLTRHLATGSSEVVSQQSSDSSGFYFGHYARPPVAARPAYSMERPYFHALSTRILNSPRSERWPVASRSPSPDQQRQEGNQKDSDSQSAKSRSPSVDQGSDVDQSEESIDSEPASPAPLGHIGKTTQTGE